MVAMLIIVLVFRLLLSLIFGIAGVAKLLDIRSTREAVTNFGAPANWSATLALLLPLAEIATAVGLLVSLIAWVSALIAVLLLGLFIAVIAVNLGRGRAPECHCFGQLYSRPLGWPTLLRSVLFAIGAGVVIWAGPQASKASGLALSEKLGVGQSLSAAGHPGKCNRDRSGCVFSKARESECRTIAESGRFARAAIRSRGAGV
jgi:uncharacterized membrane protein YphA (DoxX/SURF4 family)